MKSENNPSASGSTGAMSGDVPPKSPPNKPDPAKDPTEADFITRQQEQARAAMSAVVTNMKRALAEGGNLREWTRQFPWILTGSAAVAGFAAAMLATPSKDESLRDKWEAIKDKLTPEAPVEGTARATAAETGKKPSVLSSLLGDAMRAAGPILSSLITSAMAGQNPPPEDGNGHPGNGSYAQAGAPVGPPQN